MKKNIIKIIIPLIFLSIISLNGCLKDNVLLPFEIEIGSTEELLIYLESRGDYINSPEMPSIVEASEVYSNLDNYLIIDVRSKEDFIAGHIPGAVNLLPGMILTYLTGINISGFPKIVLVSSTGQAAAYYTSLLRLYGINNSYSMNFGMAYWHQDFADIWITASKDDPGITSGFDMFDYPKKDFSELPEVVFNNQGTTIEVKIKSRIQELMNDLFEESAFTNSLSSVSIDYYSLQTDIGNSTYYVCFGSKSFYVSKASGIGHRPNSVHYQPPPINPDLRSTAYLQTLPRNEPIVLYSHSGQLSAFAVAYLRLLGYNAKNISFGMHNLYYNTLLSVEEFTTYVFTTAKIMNYPYETGE